MGGRSASQVREGVGRCGLLVEVSQGESGQQPDLLVGQVEHRAKVGNVDNSHFHWDSNSNAVDKDESKVVD
jgi:hypothetical protein